MKLAFKRKLLKGLKFGRVFKNVAKSQWRSDRLLILCYHGISLDDEHIWKPNFSMTASDFESRLALLKSGGYSVVSLDEGLKRLYAGNLPPKSVALTFDDGLTNFYEKAWPLLRQYGYPATLYLTTYYCFNNLPVFPLICSYLLWKKRNSVVQANPKLGLNLQSDLSTENARMQAWQSIQSMAKAERLSAADKNQLAKALADHLQVDFDAIVSKRVCHLMTPDQIKEIARDGVDIQLHTHRHHSPLNRELFQEEIAENRSRITELTGKSPRHHCYPSGVCKPSFLPWLTEQKVESAATCEPGLANKNTDRLVLPRFLDAANVSPIEFESWISGAGAFLPKNPFRAPATLWYSTNRG